MSVHATIHVNAAISVNAANKNGRLSVTPWGERYEKKKIGSRKSRSAASSERALTHRKKKNSSPMREVSQGRCHNNNKKKNYYICLAPRPRIDSSFWR